MAAPAGETEHKVKHTQFLSRSVSIICQNKNGPCPLIAICNVLLLRGSIKVSELSSSITTKQLIELVGHRLIESNPMPEDIAQRRNHAKAIEDILGVLPTLSRGLDVNVAFTGITAFEYTSQTSIFDMLDMRMVHGWIVDPDDKTTTRVLGTKSYNQLVDRVICLRSPAVKGPDAPKPKCPSDALPTAIPVAEPLLPVARLATLESKDPEAASSGSDPSPAAEARVIETFLKHSSSQLTFEGLTQLHKGLRDNELAVLFRNDHFSTIFKHGGQLYLLVTDEGFSSMAHIVWEHLAATDGDTAYMSCSFAPAPTSASCVPPDTSDSDTMLAMYLQAQEDGRAVPGAAALHPPGTLVYPSGPVAAPAGIGYPAAPRHSGTVTMPPGFVAQPAAAPMASPAAVPVVYPAPDPFSHTGRGHGAPSGAPPPAYSAMPTSRLAPSDDMAARRVAPSASVPVAPVPSHAAGAAGAAGVSSDDAALRAAIELSKREAGPPGRAGATSSKSGSRGQPFYHSSGDMYAAQAAELRALADERQRRNAGRPAVPVRGYGGGEAGIVRRKAPKKKKCTIM